MAKCLKKAIAKYKDKIEWGEHESRKKNKKYRKIVQRVGFCLKLNEQDIL